MASSPKTQEELKPLADLGDYYEEPELAATLKNTTRTLRAWQAKGEGPPRTVIGKKIYYRKSSVMAWLLSREQKPLVRRGAR
jgi:hypothetical protein